MKSLKLSIITINQNNVEGLRRTIESVVSQTYIDYEYIIIDGASTDESVTVIKQFENSIKFWISEPDKGIYNAMNKGVSKASGEYCLFLNSGDYLYSNEVLQKFVKSNLHEDILVGDLLIKEKLNSIDFEIKKSPEIITAKYLFNSYLPHPSSFIKRSLFNNVGMFNENNKIVSDGEFFIKALLKFQVSYCYFPVLISVFIKDGLSCNQKSIPIFEQEKKDYLLKYFQYFYQDFINYNELENKIDKFKVSNEFKVIKILKKSGLMSLFMFVYKVFSKIQRILQ